METEEYSRKNEKCVVITSIHPPSAAICHYANLPDWDLIVVADQKTPIESYNDLANCFLLTLELQHRLFPKLAQLVPTNHYARKNLGYLYAIRQGYRWIGETDDDNIPFANWSSQHETARNPKLALSPPILNVYRLFSTEHIWPRGFPLSHINSSELIRTCRGNSTHLKQVWVWQGLVDLDPDVDAIYRLTSPNHGKDFSFMGRESVILDKNVLCPFNTQNTLWINQDSFPLLYLPCTVSMRFCDIFKSYVAQFGLWAKGGHLGFTAPTAKQERNPHNLQDDFLDEVSMYRDVPLLIDTLKSYQWQNDGQDLVCLYSLLADKEFVQKEEVEIVQEWCQLCQK